MYITLNDEKIVLNFNPYPTLKISGPDPYYLIELREFKKNEDQSLHIESYQISNGTGKWWKQFFDCPKMELKITEKLEKKIINIPSSPMYGLND